MWSGPEYGWGADRRRHPVEQEEIENIFQWHGLRMRLRPGDTQILDNTEPNYHQDLNSTSFWTLPVSLCAIAECTDEYPWILEP